MKHKTAGLKQHTELDLIYFVPTCVWAWQLNLMSVWVNMHMNVNTWPTRGLCRQCRQRCCLCNAESNKKKCPLVGLLYVFNAFFLRKDRPIQLCTRPPPKNTVSANACHLTPRLTCSLRGKGLKRRKSPSERPAVMRARRTKDGGDAGGEMRCRGGIRWSEGAGLVGRNSGGGNSRCDGWEGVRHGENWKTEKKKRWL